MQTTESVEMRETEHLREPERRAGGLAWLAGILAAAVIGLGAWLAVELTTSDGLDIPADVQTALDDYYAAWDTTDGTAFRAAVTDDYTFTSNGRVFDLDAQARQLDLQTYFDVETIDQTVSGNGPYYVASAERVFPSAVSGGAAGTSLITIEQVGGGWKVSQHTWIGSI